MNQAPCYQFRVKTRPRPGPLFDAFFTPVVQSLLAEALSAAYRTACDLHDPLRGSNESTFGFNLYHFAVHEISQLGGASISIQSRTPLFRFYVGEFELACHRVGNSERENIWSAFPNADSAAHTMIEEQLWLPGLAQYSGVEKARRLVLAHFGNADDGFRAAYLCIPGQCEGTKIIEWAHAQNIWTADQSAANPANDAMTTVPEEFVSEIVVRRKVKGTTTNAENR